MQSCWGPAFSKSHPPCNHMEVMALESLTVVVRICGAFHYVKAEEIPYAGGSFYTRGEDALSIHMVCGERVVLTLIVPKEIWVGWAAIISCDVRTLCF